VDSIKAEYGQVLLVDGGGYFPEQDERKDESWFQMDAMRLVGTDAVGVGPRDLRFGISYLRETAKGKKLPIVCANLVDKKTKTTVFQPGLVKKVGTVNVGVFGVITDKADLGPSRDSIAVTDATVAAKKAVTDLRKKGATIVVALTQLGKVESEDLLTAVDGIDACVIGLNVPVLQKGRLIRTSVACYGGEQGQNMGRTLITLDASKKMASGENETFILGPEVGEKPEILQIVKAFEDSENEKLRKLEKEKAAQQLQKSNEESPDRYLGVEICSRCHQAQADQWKTTKHAQAWDTLVKEKKTEDNECVSCHVVGFLKPGGFQGPGDVAKLANVQCESCHGMGTAHDAWPAQHARVSEQVCVTCHHGEMDPSFNFQSKLGKIVH
jgi:2',3'-cyclic-nucleotide 2'-phosphodiesterase (5'-nucleotidase family)